MTKVIKIISWFNENKNEENIKGMQRFGIKTDKTFGIKIPILRNFAKTIGKNTELARKLWQTDYHEAQILAVFITKPNELTEADLDLWVNDFNSWDICDQACMNIFDKTPFAEKKIFEWALREEEYVRRAAFAILQVLPFTIKKPVMKSLSYPLKNAGKRWNMDDKMI